MASITEFGPALDRLYAQLLACLPPEVKPSDCRITKPGRCPAISSCSPVNGFFDADGGCSDGLHFVTKGIERMQPFDLDMIQCTGAQFGLRVDVYLFPPCKGGCEKDPGWLSGVQWALTCCLYGLSIGAAWWPNNQNNGFCKNPVIDPIVSCVQEGVCRGARTSMLVPIPS
jgi:hypothetical protein